MDFDFISQFYYGNITPNIQDMPKDSDLGKASRAFSDAEELLCAALTGEEKRALLHLLNAHAEIVGISDHDSFCRGFRLGALMMLDVMGGGNTHRIT